MHRKEDGPAGSRSFNNQSSAFVKVNALALPVLPVLLKRWLPEGKLSGQEYIALNPTRQDNSLGSFKINIKTGRWADFATEDKGHDVISLAAYIFGISQGEALRRVATLLGVKL